MSNLNTPEKMDYKAFPLTRRLHKSSYDAISPSRADVSQAGKTVMITGGSMGVGYAIVKAFAVANAHKIIIVGREQTKLDTSITKLREELGEDGATTKLEGMVCQISEPDSVDHLWDLLRRDGIHVDVMVLNAVFGGSGSLQKLGWANVWAQFEVNVRSLHQFSDRFNQQSAPAGTKVIS
jgi:short-subunit dehydrogenase